MSNAKQRALSGLLRGAVKCRANLERTCERRIRRQGRDDVAALQREYEETCRELEAEQRDLEATVAGDAEVQSPEWHAYWSDKGCNPWTDGDQKG